MIKTSNDFKTVSQCVEGCFCFNIISMMLDVYAALCKIYWSVCLIYFECVMSYGKKLVKLLQFCIKSALQDENMGHHLKVLSENKKV